MYYTDTPPNCKGLSAQPVYDINKDGTISLIFMNFVFDNISPEVIDKPRKNNRKRRIILHHDNAISHMVKQTNKFMNEENVELMNNPAYSPDLAP
ncbi:hypothetical protein EVAR_94334_1 [Eumeta japonica]|uniref:Mariner Mos1 transposase n=1 Tax=Eumeta variegata TaxID=151549 RepID=A0A4C1TPV7_EUMVA|nr:hypothetical protein EVAR_94334_1 [Eumeta japonica]